MSALTVAEVLDLTGVRMIVEQGNLDHWFDAALWGNGSNPRPSGSAFNMALSANLIERSVTGERYRLTDLGRKHRAALAREQQA